MLNLLAAPQASYHCAKKQHKQQAKSEDQVYTALAVNPIPREQFEAFVEGAL